MERAPDRKQVDLRPAEPRDYSGIQILMDALELSYPAMDLSCFWVAERDGAIIGAAEIRDFRHCSLLSCVGVREEMRGLGIGRILVERVVRDAPHDVYLYTLVPDFFRKAGFADAELPPPDLPPRSIYGCEDCDPRRCFCLVRRRDDP